MPLVFKQTATIPALIDASLHDIEDAFVYDGAVSRMTFDITNTGANLTAFAMLVKPHASSAGWSTYLTTTGWDTVAGTLNKFVGTIKTLATGSTGYADVNIGPVYAVKFQASIASGARSTGTLTLVTAVPVAAETVTIGAKVYTWRAAPTTVANEVKIGATMADSCDNLVAAINGDAGSGTLYGSATVAHTQVSAARASNTVVLTALTTISATIGNAIATSETMTNGSFGAATLGSGLTTAVVVSCNAYAAS